jgi:DNA-binding CsgD family transcriptional regulator
MRFKGTDRKALTAAVAQSPVIADYARLYPDAPRRTVEMIAGLSAEYEAQGMAVLIETADPPEARNERLRTRYGLTESEARLALHIADGGSLPAYAAARGVSRNTARNQLQQVFEKTDTQRQAQLVKLLADC